MNKWAADLALAEPKNDVYRWVIENQEGEFGGMLNTHTCDPGNGSFQYGLGRLRRSGRVGIGHVSAQQTD